MRPWLVLPVFALAALAGSCALLPERFAVNGPMANSLFGSGPGRPSDALLEQRIELPPGFHIEVFAEDLRARALRFTEAGDLLVSTPRDGAIWRLAPDRDGDWRSDSQHLLLDHLDRPYGIDLHGGWLYVAEGEALGRVRFDPASGETRGEYQRIATGLPGGGNHWTRTLRVGPDEHLYVSVGSSCNACVEDDPRRAALLRYRLDGSGEEIYASGLRNAVDFDWQPGTGELYATDNGRDTLGDDFPPCELNRIVKQGFYGWPFANGPRVPDPDLGRGREAQIAASLPPAHGFGAHTAPLGITFVSGPRAPHTYRGAALVALHGSWNRTRKSGYKVVSLHWQADGSVVERDFATGFERDEEVIGRPAHVAVGPDGAFYVSDDYAHVVYRIAQEPAPAWRLREADAATPRPGGARPIDPQAAARGAALYEVHVCFRCHEAERLEPGLSLVDFRPGLRRHDVDSLASFLAAPTPPMPVAPLSPAERRELAAYLLSEFRSR